MDNVNQQAIENQYPNKIHIPWYTFSTLRNIFSMLLILGVDGVSQNVLYNTIFAVSFLCFLIVVLLATYKYLNYMIRFVTINIQIIYFMGMRARGTFL